MIYSQKEKFQYQMLCRHFLTLVLTVSKDDSREKRVVCFSAPYCHLQRLLKQQSPEMTYMTITKLVKLRLLMIKSVAKKEKNGHIQKLAILKKATFFAQSSFFGNGYFCFCVGL